MNPLTPGTPTLLATPCTGAPLPTGVYFLGAGALALLALPGWWKIIGFALAAYGGIGVACTDFSHQEWWYASNANTSGPLTCIYGTKCGTGD